MGRSECAKGEVLGQHHTLRGIPVDKYDKAMPNWDADGDVSGLKGSTEPCWLVS